MAERQREELRRVGADIALHGRQAARGSPTPGSLTILEDYAMDTGGYIILRSVISPDQAAALAGEPAAAVERQLAGNETVAECVEGLCGAGWRQDSPLALLPPNLQQGDLTPHPMSKLPSMPRAMRGLLRAQLRAQLMARPTSLIAWCRTPTCTTPISGSTPTCRARPRWRVSWRRCTGRCRSS